MKKSLPIVLLCVVMTAPVLAAPRDTDRDFRSRFRDRLIRTIRVVLNGDALTPPLPAPKP